jgi:hypothetical protein
VIAVRTVQTGGPIPEVYLETLDVETDQRVVVRDNGPGLFTWFPNDADFSPDGENIVYGSSSPGNIEIVIAGQEDDPIEATGPSGGPNGHVAWSPNGAFVVFPTHDQTSAEVLAVHNVTTDARTTFASAAAEVDWAPVPSETPDGFIDVPEDSTFYEDILWLAGEGITRGCNPPANDRFCPDDFVTRGQMAAFLHRGLDDFLTPTEMVEFIDDDGNTFETDIEWLGGTGVTRGCNPPTNDRFCPDDFVTRGQMAAFLHRALGD